MEDVLRDGLRRARPALSRAWTQVVNIKRDPFETSIGQQQKTLLVYAGALAGPVTANVYDWNLSPIGQALWLKEPETYINLPAAAGPGKLQFGAGHAADPGNEDDQSYGRVAGLTRTKPRAAPSP